MPRDPREIDNRPITRRPPIVKNPRTRPKLTLHAQQKWEGCVVKIRNGEVVAQLVDLTAGDSFPTER